MVTGKNARIGLQADKHMLSYPMARRSISLFPANRIAAGSRGQFTGSSGHTEDKACPYFYIAQQYTGDSMAKEIIIVSTPYVPGYKITRTIGVTWGLIVRSRGLGRNITAGLRSIIGGEIHEYTELLNQSREQALDRLREHAQAIGANAVVSMQFDSSEIG